MRERDDDAPTGSSSRLSLGTTAAYRAALAHVVRYTGIHLLTY
jgi:hypothetical protein